MFPLAMVQVIMVPPVTALARVHHLVLVEDLMVGLVEARRLVLAPVLLVARARGQALEEGLTPGPAGARRLVMVPVLPLAGLAPYGDLLALQVGPPVVHQVLRAGGAQPPVPVLVLPLTRAQEQVPVHGLALMGDPMMLQAGDQASVPVLVLVPVPPLTPTLARSPVGDLMRPLVGAPTPVLPLVRLQKQVRVHHLSVERDHFRLRAMVQVLVMALDQAQEKVVVQNLVLEEVPMLLQVEALTLILNRVLLLTLMQVRDQVHLLVQEEELMLLLEGA